MSARPTRQITPTSPSPSPSPRLTQTARLEEKQETVAATQPTAVETHANPNSDPTPPSNQESIRIELESKVKTVVDSLYQLAVCAADVQSGSEHMIGHKINESIQALADLEAIKVDLHEMIPEDVIEMLDHGRNPDIHTRNFITRLASENQYSFGQHHAIKEYHSKLTESLDQAFPALAFSPSKDTST